MDMANKAWRLDPNPIVFDVDGNLLNGQHRLEALRRSGVTCKFFVSYGWPSETMHVLDCGAPRTIANMMQLDGVASSASMAATLKHMCRIVYRGHTSPVSYAQVTALLQQEGVASGIHSIATKAPSIKEFRGSIVAPLVYYHTTNPKKAAAFATSMFNFETVAGSPVRALLNWRKDHQAKNSKHSKVEYVLQAMSCAIKAWDSGNDLTRITLHYDNTEWLANTNPKLKQWIRSHTAYGRNTPAVQ